MEQLPLKLTIPRVLAAIRAEMDLTRETERDLLEEIEGHLEDALAAAVERGEDEEQALLDVVEAFGLAEVGQALQAVHAPWESADAIIACALPVLAALILRWLVFAPDGSAIGWEALLVRPAFWVTAMAILLIPIIHFRRWSYALVSWGFFWAVTIIFMTLPNIQKW